MPWFLVAASANQFKVFHCAMRIETWESDLFETHNIANIWGIIRYIVDTYANHHKYIYTHILNIFFLWHLPKRTRFRFIDVAQSHILKYPKKTRWFHPKRKHPKAFFYLATFFRGAGFHHFQAARRRLPQKPTLRVLLRRSSQCQNLGFHNGGRPTDEVIRHGWLGWLVFPKRDVQFFEGI